MMNPTDLNGILDFLRHTEQLKNTLRSAWTSEGRPESAAEHTWRLALMVMMFERHYPEIDFARLLKMCIIHDLGEVIRGDIPAIHQTPGSDKAGEERRDLLKLLEPLPEYLQDDITALWDEYEAAETSEAKLAKAFDKLETILQHNQGKNPSDFDYRFNLGYGARFTAGDPLVEAIREILDLETERRAKGSDS